LSEFSGKGKVTIHSPDEYAVMVLLVDDQPMVGEAVRRALASDPGIHMHYCSDPDAAVALAEQISPTVILQDLVMPNVDGLSLVRQYRANPATKGIPIIVLSTKEDAAIKSAAFTAGANDYIVKLPDKIELIARIRHHSRAYLNQIQRDEAYLARRESQQQLIQTNLELQRLNNVDGLTGLSNKGYVNEVMATEWKRAIREQVAISILMIDVDEFKRYNDTYGHLAGDEVLKRISKTISESVSRPADLAARFGGEEFIVVLPVTALPGAIAMGERLRGNIESLGIAHSTSCVGNHVTVSVGVASTIPQRADEYLRLIELADSALYEAKRAGRNKVIASQQANGSHSI
jgi:two-component system, chemotaxis family, response regulator WspR